MKRKIRAFIANDFIPFLFHLRGGKEVWLDKQPDLSYMGIESILVEKARSFTFSPTWDWNSLPAGQEASAQPNTLLPAETVNFHDSYVYKLDYSRFGDCTRRWGVIVLPGARALLTGFSRQRFHLATLLPRNPFRIRREKLILCPQPYPGGTYGDVLNITLPRLCTILMTLNDKEKSEACVAMPFANEITHQLVERLGIPRERHIDSRRECFGLTKDGTAVTCNTPLKIHVPEKAYRYMRNALCPQHTEAGTKRIYIQRQHTRRILSEAQYLPKLLDMGFTVFDDSPRTLDEQMELFHGAEALVCAHGAGQVNMLWANPQVKVLELRDAGLWLNCFRLWSLYNGARHELMIDWTRSQKPDWRLDCGYVDLKAAPEAVLRATRELLNEQPSS